MDIKNKQLFVEAYQWMYGASKATAEVAFKNSKEEYVLSIIECYKSFCKDRFYYD